MSFKATGGEHRLVGGGRSRREVLEVAARDRARASHDEKAHVQHFPLRRHNIDAFIAQSTA
jgi:hypothetical protein